MTSSPSLRRQSSLALLLASGLAVVAACAPTLPPAPAAPPAPIAPPPEPPPPAPPPAPPPPPAPAPPIGVVELASRAGEQALLAGLRAYDDGQYVLAEQKLRAALKAGLAAPKDRAAAHKTLAFVYCTSDRLPRCEAAFRAARAADAKFALSKAEAGHPVWGPVYRRVLNPR
ncbi:MAG TPA: TssQ family T6SS-associated lipoprotein [Methylibium sp.]|uniref:TssQ family T6SS-associated lipoprotein n=1 Tax=Methylibium sp. TaxID=2067992 RepID=UPI002DB9E5C8|nr:TssQ family T6SS-associated lipoprotein [Methylibium sp.]HEU4457530.1 TssQ family T6SS-associated lipoprotein [Methylibium sp.]